MTKAKTHANKKRVLPIVEALATTVVSTPKILLAHLVELFKLHLTQGNSRSQKTTIVSKNDLHYDARHRTHKDTSMTARQKSHYFNMKWTGSSFSQQILFVLKFLDHSDEFGNKKPDLRYSKP